MATFPVSACELEILYPIQNAAKSNVLVFRKDSREWDRVQKSSTEWRHEFYTMRCRVRDTHIEQLVDFITTNKGDIVTLDTPGMTPFIRNASSNNVYLMDYTRPVLEMPRHFIMSITFIYSVKVES